MYKCRCTCTILDLNVQSCILPVQFVKRLYTCKYTVALNTADVPFHYSYVELYRLKECCVHVPSVPSTECVSVDSDNGELYQLQQAGTIPHVTHPHTIQVQHTDHNLVTIHNYYLIDKLR